MLSEVNSKPQDIEIYADGSVTWGQSERGSLPSMSEGLYTKTVARAELQSLDWPRRQSHAPCTGYHPKVAHTYLMPLFSRIQ